MCKIDRTKIDRMTVICVKSCVDEFYRSDKIVKENELYQVIEITEIYYSVCQGSKYYGILPKCNFSTLEEHRDRQINSLL